MSKLLIKQFYIVSDHSWNNHNYGGIEINIYSNENNENVEINYFLDSKENKITYDEFIQYSKKLDYIIYKKNDSYKKNLQFYKNGFCMFGDNEKEDIIKYDLLKYICLFYNEQFIHSAEQKFHEYLQDVKKYIDTFYNHDWLTKMIFDYWLKIFKLVKYCNFNSGIKMRFGEMEKDALAYWIYSNNLEKIYLFYFNNKYNLINNDAYNLLFNYKITNNDIEHPNKKQKI